ncbi:MAG: D-2-hydroxyacid dehydrogenase [Gemmatimonadota bacterium]
MTRASRRFLIWMFSPEYPLWSIPPRSVEAIRSALGPDWEVVSLEIPVLATGDGARDVPAELLDAISEAEVYCGFGIPRPAFLAARRVRWVHSGAAGVGGSLFDEMRASDVPLTNSAGIHAEPMAEHVLGMLLYFARGLDRAEAGRRAREWRYSELAGPGSPVRELSGSRLGIVGYGRIGAAVAHRAAGLGVRVRAIRRTPGGLPAPLEALDGPEALPDLLSACDYVVLTVPLTPSTEGMIGAPQLARMAPGSVLVNVSRGALVDEEALCVALESGRLRGAGLDAFRCEPLPGESPLWELDNVLITPHASAISPEYWDRETDLIVRNIGRYLAGETLENLVDKQQGY